MLHYIVYEPQTSKSCSALSRIKQNVSGLFMQVTRALVRAKHRAMRCIQAASVKSYLLACETLENQSGQGTTEYAILVGVIVVIAIVAIVSFKDKISELWQSIASGINSL